MEDGAGISYFWLALHFWLLLTPVRCMCPSRCTCRDEALMASCVAAGLEVVPIQLNPDIEVIDLRGNRIGNVDYTLTFYTKLKKLDVSLNRVISLKSRNFENQGELVSLNSSFNQISTLSKDAFYGLKLLRHLDLSHNNISVIDSGAFRDTADLQSIDLSHNSLTSFPDPTVFKHISALGALHLHHNDILDVPSDLLNNLPHPCVLETLSLSFNLIEVIDEKSFPPPCSHSIKSLTLGSNVINDIDKSAFNSLSNLAGIDLSFNNFTYIPTMQLSKLSKLRELDLSGNRFPEIKAVAFQSLFQLRVLTLSKLMHLVRIDTRAFVDNIRLETLYLDENEGLTRIPHRIFHGNPKLMHISLRGNAISTADASHFPLDKLRSLDLSGNPLHCNCSLHWLWKLVKMENDVIESTTIPFNNTLEELGPQLRLIVRNLRCAGPEDLRGRSVADIPESTVRCETTWMTVLIVSVLVLGLFVAICFILLSFGNEKGICSSRRGGKQEPDPTEGDTRRLAAGLHAVGGPQPILMLMPDKHYKDSIMAGYLRPEEDVKAVEPWMNGPQAQNDYTIETNRKKKPHIVYV